MSDDNNSSGYEVGYGKPPAHSRWVKGQSGNAKGRKKGSRGLKTDLDEALKTQLTITVNGKKRKGTTQALALYAMAMKAATGDMRAIKQLTDLILSVFGPDDRNGDGTRLSSLDQELLKRLLDRVEVDDSATPDAAVPIDNNSDCNTATPGSEGRRCHD